VTEALVACILVPLGGAVLAYLIGPRLGQRVALAAVLASGVASVAVTVGVASAGPVTLAMGGWSPPLGIALRADGLSAVLLAMTGVVGVAVSAYAVAYFRVPHGRRDGDPLEEGGWQPALGFWPLWLMAWGGLNALFLSADLFNIYVALEILTLAAVALVVLGGERTALVAAMRYLLAAFAGSMLYLFGVALLYAEVGSLDLGLVAGQLGDSRAAAIASALMSIGLLVKTALFPLHFWLPRAHASAPAPVSAVLSALVVKASFYLLLRLWFEVFPDAALPVAGQLLGVLGAAAIVWGSLQAIRSQRLKMLIAHSTVAQIGYLFLVFPLATAPAGAGGVEAALGAWNGGIYHAISHALAKAAMFLTAGSVMLVLGHDRLPGLTGVATRVPIAFFAFGLAGISLVGLPPTGGFVGKWLLLEAAIGTGQWWWAAVILVGGILTAGYVFLVLGHALAEGAGSEGPPPAPPARTPAVLQFAPLGLSLLGLLLGVRALEALDLIGGANPFGIGPGVGD
jgi:multicomponent Na+:H+ antiporter subunit D